MNKYFKIALSLLFSFFTGIESYAQNQAIGHWRSLLPYRYPTSVALDGGKALVATEVGFYVLDEIEDELTLYSKVNGMHDIRPNHVRYDPLSETAIITYSNSNIDLFKDHEFFNIPYLKDASSSGDKNVRHVSIIDGLAYVCSGMGVVVINLENKEIKETYQYTINNQNVLVTNFVKLNQHYYISTDRGLYSTPISTVFLQDFSKWSRVNDEQEFIDVTVFNQHIYTASKDSVYVLNNGQLQAIFGAPDGVSGIDKGSVLYIKVIDQNLIGKVYMMDSAYQLTDSLTNGYPHDVAENAVGKIFIADSYSGLRTKEGNKPWHDYHPNSPAIPATFKILAKNNQVILTHGAFNEKMEAQNVRAGLSIFKHENWTTVGRNPGSVFENMIDLVDAAQANENSPIYSPSFQNGVYVLHSDGKQELLNDTSIFGISLNNPPAIKACGINFDENGILWMTLFDSDYELIAMTPDGQFYKHKVGITRPNYIHNAGKIIFDNSNELWYLSPYGGGVIVYNHNNTIGNSSDDSYRLLRQGKGAGNLPSNNTISLAKDKDGSIWVGTDNGIGIINCPEFALAGQCEAELRVVQYDQFAGYLFENEAVKAIAVDGANRKWIGTNNGVWLLSETGDKILKRFTTENSPLPSNIIFDIAIEPQTGVVYFGTEYGLVSYRGDATEDEEGNEIELITFPNPVQSNYHGPIAIKNVNENAEVRITDISGQLVYKANATGGQLVWNGLDYTGHRPQSGVYLIFTTNRDGSETQKGKLIFME